MRSAPDDELWRGEPVWLGPANGGRALTFPWVARYKAYATWLAMFLILLLVEAVTPLHVGVPPIWEICLTTLSTYGLLSFLDHDRTIRGLIQTVRAELTAPRPAKPTTQTTRIRAREWALVLGRRDRVRLRKVAR